MYKLFLICCWIAVEIVACKFKIKASGYTKSQLAVYDLYQTSLVEMGEITGFGEGWSPMWKIVTISAINAAIFLGFAHYLGGNEQGTKVAMSLVSQFILGKNPTIAENDIGVPEPSSNNPLGGLFGGSSNEGGTQSSEKDEGTPSEGGASNGGLGGLGALLGNLGGINLQNLDLGSIIANIGTSFTANMQNANKGGNKAGTKTDTTKTESTEEKRDRRKNRRKGPSVSL